MTTRCKMTCRTVDEGVTGLVELSPVCGDTPENKAFWDATPSGRVTLWISNPAGKAVFEQNDPAGAWPLVATHDYTGVLGWIYW